MLADLTSADVLLAAAALAGILIDGRRMGGDAEHRERTVERLTEHLDAIDDALASDDEPERPPKATPRKR